MANGMQPGDRVAYTPNDFPTFGTVREAGTGERTWQYRVAWDDDAPTDWFPASELAVIEKAEEA